MRGQVPKVGQCGSSTTSAHPGEAAYFGDLAQENVPESSGVRSIFAPFGRVSCCLEKGDCRTCRLSRHGFWDPPSAGPKCLLGAERVSTVSSHDTDSNREVRP
jgi:hypothetical protein